MKYVLLFFYYIYIHVFCGQSTCTTVDIHPELCAVYRKNIKNDSAVKKWCRWSGMDEITSMMKKKVEDHLLWQMKFKRWMRKSKKTGISELSNLFPQVSWAVLYWQARLCHKLYACWVPTSLNGEHKTMKMGGILTLHLRYCVMEGNNFLTILWQVMRLGCRT